jgi:hypothetical protein
MKPILQVLSRTSGSKVGDIQDMLAELWGADSVEFHYAGGERKVRADASIEYILENPVELRAFFSPATGQPMQTPATVQNNSLTASTSPPTSPEQERFIRDLDILERRNAFTWIKFIMNERLPQIGIPAAESRQFIDQLLHDGVIVTKKLPNPNNPDFPSTVVALNRTHPVVQQILNGGRGTFEPIEMPGGPLSDDIIRDRR